MGAMNSTRYFEASEVVRLPALGPRTSWTVALLVLSDLTALAAAAGAAAALVALWNPSEIGLLLWPQAMLLAYPLAYGGLGLYPGTALGPIDEFRRLSRATAIVALFGTSTLALVGSDHVALAAALAGLAALGTVPLGRALTRELHAHKPWWGVPVVILGAGLTARLVIERLRQTPRAGLKPIACLDDDPAKHGSHILGVPVTGPLEDAGAYVAKHVRHGIVAMPGVSADALVGLTSRHGDGFPTLILIPNLFGIRTVGVDVRDVGGILGLHLRHHLLNPVNRAVKRGADLAILLLLGLPAVSIIALAALGIMVVSPGTPFYAQRREGLRGRPIRVWKLRTMHLDAEARLARHLDDDPTARQEWTRHFKLRHDPRVIPLVGELLRRASLDELPQLFNVLRGEMSFVGPRPFPEYHLQAFDRSFRDLRSTVPPGITGLWQVSARSDGDLTVQQELDTYYIRNWSLWMDLYVLVRTPLAVISARGAR
jgi:Undecaprenyl-phosphate galactose phosphotransferase WbaP